MSGRSVVTLAYYALPLLAVVLHVALGYWLVENHWDRAGARWFVAMLGAGGLSAFLFWLYLLWPPGVVKRNLFYPIALLAFVSYVLWAVFAGKYTRTNFHRSWPIRAAIVVILGGFVALTLVIPVRNVLLSEVRLVTEPVPYYAYDIGPGLGAVYLLVYLLSGYTTYRLFVYLRSTSARATRQLLLLVAGALSVVAIVAASQLGLFPASELNHATYATIPFILLATGALFRFDLFSVQPVARNAVVQDLRDPVLVLDGERRVVDYNDAASRIWPDLGANLGEPFRAACPQLAEAVEEGDDGTTGRLTLSFDGEERHYSADVSPVAGGEEGETQWLSVLLRDVTEIEQSRWQLEKQNERLDQVASTISHDLRNPINVAEGHAELLGTVVDDAVDPSAADAAHEHLDEIRSSHDRMVDIVEDILTIAREGKTVAETTELGLESVAREAWGNVDTKAATLTVREDRPLRADRSKLLTILENLFRNALDHGPETVSVTVGTAHDGFYVADDGPGIPAEHADSVFEYGYTTSEGGTGLGLAIVRTMAESHGWTVRLAEGCPRADGSGATAGGGSIPSGTCVVFADVDGSPVVDDTDGLDV